MQYEFNIDFKSIPPEKRDQVEDALDDIIVEKINETIYDQ